MSKAVCIMSACLRTLKIKCVNTCQARKTRNHLTAWTPWSGL